MRAVHVFLGLMLLFAAPAQAQQLQLFQTAPLTIETAAGETHEFTVELALTPGQRQQGLMFRQSMAPDGGMLFTYDKPGRPRMWMANTLIPLDMLFIRGDGTIAHIAENTVPQNATNAAEIRRITYTTPVPVSAVLELNAGTTRRLGIKPGDKVTNALLGAN